MRRTSAIVLLVALAALTPFAAAAQEATPPPGAVVPGPEECRVPPRSPEAIVAVIATPAAEPGTVATDVPVPGGSRTVASEDEFPTGEPADAAAAEAVEAAVRELVACGNADDFSRGLSLFSDDLFRALVTEAGVPAAELAAELAAAQPTPKAEDEREVILAIRDARVFPDGRVGVVVVTDSLDDYEEGPELDLLVLVQTAERWLVDAVINVDPEAAGS